MDWKFTSPETIGWHEVVSPVASPCRITWMYRLNLAAGTSHELGFTDREISGGVVTGEGTIAVTGGPACRLKRFTGFYLPGGQRARITATTPMTVYLGAGPWEGVGEFFVRTVDLDMPPGPIRQVHGRPPFRRDVFLTLDPGTPASRLITGFTWGDAGAWTSWPPHQHSRDLEEVYAYFDIPRPAFALHLAYRRSGEIERIFPVAGGDFVAIPEGYHPTIAMPGVRSAYFWVMVAHRRASRRYDLAVNDPAFAWKECP